jgi:hypothetical protein
MKRKEERDLERAIAWDEQTIDWDTALEVVKANQEESRRFFAEVGQALFQGSTPNFIAHRRKRVGAGLAKHWFIYEYQDNREVRLLTSDQYIKGGKSIALRMWKTGFCFRICKLYREMLAICYVCPAIQ